MLMAQHQVMGMRMPKIPKRQESTMDTDGIMTDEDIMGDGDGDNIMDDCVGDDDDDDDVAVDLGNSTRGVFGLNGAGEQVRGCSFLRARASARA